MNTVARCHLTMKVFVFFFLLVAINGGVLAYNKQGIGGYGRKKLKFVINLYQGLFQIQILINDKY